MVVVAAVLARAGDQESEIDHCRLGKTFFRFGLAADWGTFGLVARREVGLSSRLAVDWGIFGLVARRGVGPSSRLAVDWEIFGLFARREVGPWSSLDSDFDGVGVEEMVTGLEDDPSPCSCLRVPPALHDRENGSVPSPHQGLHHRVMHLHLHGTMRLGTAYLEAAL